jgi:hypothetical protein
MNQPKLVARVERRALIDLPAYVMHDQRTGGRLDHIDPVRTQQNRVLVGSDNAARDVHAALTAIAAQNLEEELRGLRRTRGKKAAAKREAAGPKAPYDGKNTKPRTEILLSASPSYFRKEG